MIPNLDVVDALPNPINHAADFVTKGDGDRSVGEGVCFLGNQSRTPGIFMDICKYTISRCPVYFMINCQREIEEGRNDLFHIFLRKLAELGLAQGKL